MPTTPTVLPLVLVAFLATPSTADAQSPFVTFPASDVDDLTGRSVTSVGDVDGDGFDDVAVGSPGYDVPSSGPQNCGRVSVYSGRTGAKVRDHVGGSTNEELGYAITGVGDVDLDGFTDLLATRPGVIVSGIGTTSVKYGGARLYSGATGGLLMTVGGVLDDDARLGHTALDVGDVDFDGRSDFVLGAPYYDKSTLSGGSLIDAGAVRVYSGTGATISTLEGIYAANSHYGWAVAGVGDVNGDGKYDLIIGAPHYDHLSQPIADIGAYHVRNIYGGSLGGAYGIIHAGYRYGYSLASLGDLDGDGVGDYMIGAPGADTNGLVDNGVAYAKKGQNGVPLGTFPGKLGGEQAGSSVASAGDVNGDGVIDLLVGAPTSSYSSPFGVASAGVARLYSGSNDALLETYKYLAPYQHAGTSVAGAGDVNGDGRADVLVGAPGSTGLITVQGAALLFLGGDVAAKWSLYGASLPGTVGPPALALASAPKLCTINTLSLTSSSNVATPATLFLGVTAADLPTGFGASVLVAPPWIATNLLLPPGTTAIPVATPCDATLNGVEVFMQLLCSDPGAPAGVSFSQGMKVVHGT